jgi:membrane protease YdiL (CAAX protease family)
LAAGTLSHSASSWFRTASGALRAPWQVTVFCLVFLAASILIGGLVYALLALTPFIMLARLTRIPVDATIGVFCGLAATAITARLLGREAIWRYIGFDRAAWSRRELGIATLFGAAVITVPALLLVATGAAHFESSSSSESGLFMIWGALALLIPAALTEELLFRGFAFSVVRDAIGAKWAVALTSVVFGLAHLKNPGPTVSSIFAVVVAGVFLGAVRVATASLAAAFVAHLWVNVTQLVILHAPVSGQAFDKPGYRLVPTGPAWLTGGEWGPEGGVAAMIAMLAASFLLLKSAPKRTDNG